MLSFILWNFNPDLYSGPPIIKWYGLLFATGFLLSQQVLFYVYKQEMGPSELGKKNAEKLVESLTVYMILATIIGARLGHVLFYQPMDYLADPIRILNIREGGLASHGALVGILFAIWIFSKYRFNTKKGHKRGLFFIPTNRGYSYFQILDRLVIVVALTGALIRFGNFTNSEIIGKPTHSDYGVVFARDVTDYLLYDANGSGWLEEVTYQADPTRELDEQGNVPVNIHLDFKNIPHAEFDVVSFMDNGINSKLSRVPMHVYEPVMHNLDYDLVKTDAGYYSAVVQTYMVSRHPAQLYESVSSLLLFFLMFFLWSKLKIKTPEGRLFSLFLILLFSLRFFYEFMKENQVAFEDNMSLNMGQWLSIPPVLICVYIFVQTYRNPKVPANSQGTGS
jgi:phosphatidylglycerol:prolipoprotein diacylglycerol transferase